MIVIAPLGPERAVQTISNAIKARIVRGQRVVIPKNREGKVADITYSSSEDTRKVIFKADTPEAEEYMGAEEITVAASEAAEFKKRAEAAGLAVIPFP